MNYLWLFLQISEISYIVNMERQKILGNFQQMASQTFFYTYNIHLTFLCNFKMFSATILSLVLCIAIMTYLQLGKYLYFYYNLFIQVVLTFDI